MSMQIDYAFPRQVDDIERVKVAIGRFQTNMTKMMLLMKDFGVALESVSQSFRELTSCSFSQNEGVKHYVEAFRAEVSLLKDGSCFKDYNRLVHEAVVQPIEELKKVVKSTEKQKEARERTYKKYQDAKSKVDQIEKEYARKSKPLTSCAKYPQLKKKREGSLQTFQTENETFQASFRALVERVEDMTGRSLREYLHLNGAYMAAVLHCLTACDDSVQGVVARYKAQKLQERRAAVAVECARVDAALRLAPVGRDRSDGVLSDPSSSGPPVVPYATPRVSASGPPPAAVERVASAPVDVVDDHSMASGELSEPLTERQLIVRREEGVPPVYADPACEPINICADMFYA
ncbi:hypothetical protein STCU_05408 [Strigomonas culicis]|uniref:BAR domain-containing protein n=1 Tax=Strigomonas culicis TaxID=28005 RepID=S9VWJ5_9TRYP|nr:hypothetical protein STCU_05408 [Strigomonas culicis]|eukprot:EPY27930.1 hypothetical protein STCU_05408 [Strigomonas culicis]